MKLKEQPLLPKESVELKRELTDHAVQINLMASGKIAACINAATAAPTTGTHARGDFVRNSAPAELGTAGSKYVVFGWMCVVGGTPGTWLQCRFLTGN